MGIVWLLCCRNIIERSLRLAYSGLFDPRISWESRGIELRYKASSVVGFRKVSRQQVGGMMAPSVIGGWEVKGKVRDEAYDDSEHYSI